MTRETAIKGLKAFRKEFSGYEPNEEMFDMAIKALEQEPTENDLGVDCIDRQATLNAIIKRLGISNESYLLQAEKTIYQQIKDMPSVTPQEPKTGYWYIDERPESNREVTCSNCDKPIFKYHRLDFDYRPKYCPNCGARMVEPQESEDT